MNLVYLQGDDRLGLSGHIGKVQTRNFWATNESKTYSAYVQPSLIVSRRIFKREWNAEDIAVPLYGTSKFLTGNCTTAKLRTWILICVRSFISNMTFTLMNERKEEKETGTSPFLKKMQQMSIRVTNSKEKAIACYRNLFHTHALFGEAQVRLTNRIGIPRTKGSQKLLEPFF